MSTIKDTYTRDEIIQVVAESQIDPFRGETTDAVYQLHDLLAHFGIEVTKP